MNSSPQQPEDKKEKQEDIEAALERRRKQLLEMETTSVVAAPSWGERLLPFLFAAMETCWIDAILIGMASLKLFQAGEPLLPLWAPFVFIAGSLWLARYLERREASVTSGTSGTAASSDESKDASSTSGSSGTSLIVALVGLVTLFIIWLQIYAQTAFVFDPTWILAMLNDILLLNVHAYQIFATVGLAVYLCWRGIRLSRRELEPAHAFSTLRIGLVVIIAVILVRTGQEHTGTVFHDEVLLFLLIPVFVFLSLFAHALARAAFVRREHPVGLQGSIVAQERSITLVLGGISLILLLVVLIVASMASSAFFTDAQHTLAPIGAAYEWLVGGLARVLAFLFTPIFWLLEAIHFRTPQIRRLTPSTKPGQPNRPTTSTSDTAATIAVLVPILKILLPILLMLLAIMIIRLALRRRRIRMLSAKRAEDLHESLWSWTLFWTQLKAFFRSLFGRFLPRKEGGSEEQTALATIQGGPAVRTIREVYRALLKRAASLGYARKKDETPYEFQQRLDEKVPMAEPHLAMITEVYTATRYGDVVPDEDDVVRVRNSWIELEEKLGEHSARGSRGS